MGRKPIVPWIATASEKAAVIGDIHGNAEALRELLVRLRSELPSAAPIFCTGVVDAKDDARAFYRKLGFEAMAAVQGALGDRPLPTPLVIPIEKIPGAR